MNVEFRTLFLSVNIFIMSLGVYATQSIKVAGDVVINNSNRAELVLQGKEFSADWVANQYISAITTNWNYVALQNRLDPTIQALYESSYIQGQFHRYKLYGKLKSLRWPAASGRSTSAGMIWNCATSAEFENAEAEILIRLKETSENRWLILTFSIHQTVSDGSVSREVLSKLSLAELKERYDELVTDSFRDKTTEIKENGELLLAYKDRLLESDENTAAIDVLRNYLQGIPTDLGNQIILADMLKGVDEEERSMRLKYVYQNAENAVFIREASEALQLKPDTGVLTNSVEFCSDKLVDVLVFPLGDIDDVVYRDLVTYLQKHSGLNIVFLSERVDLPEPQTNYRDWFVDGIFIGMLSNIPERAHPLLCVQVGLDVETNLKSLSVEEKEQFIRDVLMMNANGEELVTRLEKELAAAKGKNIYEAYPLAEYLKSMYSFKNRTALAYVGICDKILLIDGKRRPYGVSSGAYGVVSTHNFEAVQTGETENRERLVDRTGKQALNTIGFTLGVPRCLTPDCARAYPKTIQFQDSKKSRYCDICSARLAEAVSRRNLMPSEALGVAIDYREQKKYELAEEWVQKCLDSDPKPQTQCSAYLVRADCLYYQGYYKEAYAQCLKVVKTYPADMRKNTVTSRVLSKLIKGSVYSESEKRKFIDQLLAIEPANIDWLTVKILFLCDINAVDEARLLLGLVEVSDPTSSKFWNAKLAVCKITGDNEGLQESLKHLGKLNPSSEYIRYHHALELKKSGHVEEAEKEFKELLDQNPDHLQGIHNFAIMLASMKRYDEAIELEKRAVELEPEELTYWSALGYTYYLKGETRKALDCYERAVGTLGGKIGPQVEEHAVFYDGNGTPLKAGNKVALLFYNKALAHLAMEDLDLAKKSYYKALEMGSPRQKAFEERIGLRVMSL